MEPATPVVTEAGPLDDESREWLRGLRASGPEREEAIDHLHALLLRAARFEVSRRRPAHPHLRGDDLDDIAHQAADDALMSILRRLDDFRGASRFTTWAYKFAINMALSAARRESRKSVSLDALLEATGGQVWLPEAEAFPGDPERTARRAEAWAAIHTVMDDDLSERQRRALKAVIVDQVPLDELARHWGATRNAIYKLVHDARRKLKTRLEARGFAPREMLALFSRPR
jgi:RNA polymerase sigma-70 factor (ECF subfamily)